MKSKSLTVDEFFGESKDHPVATEDDKDPINSHKHSNQEPALDHELKSSIKLEPLSMEMDESFEQESYEDFQPVVKAIKSEKDPICEPYLVHEPVISIKVESESMDISESSEQDIDQHGNTTDRNFKVTSEPEDY